MGCVKQYTAKITYRDAFPRSDYVSYSCGDICACGNLLLSARNANGLEGKINKLELLRADGSLVESWHEEARTCGAEVMEEEGLYGVVAVALRWRDNG